MLQHFSGKGQRIVQTGTPPAGSRGPLILPGGLSLLTGVSVETSNKEEVNLDESPNDRREHSLTRKDAWEGCSPASSSRAARYSRSAARTPTNALRSPSTGRRSVGPPRSTSPGSYQAKFLFNPHLSTVDDDVEGRQAIVCDTGAARSPNVMRSCSNDSAQYRALRGDSNPPQSPPNVRHYLGPPPGIQTRRTTGSPPAVSCSLTSDSPCGVGGHREITRRSMGSSPIVSHRAGAPNIATDLVLPIRPVTVEGLGTCGGQAQSTPTTATRRLMAAMDLAATDTAALLAASPRQASLVASPFSRCRGTGHLVVVDSVDAQCPTSSQCEHCEAPLLMHGSPPAVVRSTHERLVARQMSIEAGRSVTPCRRSVTPSVQRPVAVMPKSPEVHMRVVRPDRLVAPVRSIC